MILSACILMKGEAEQLRRMAAMVSPLADEVVVVCDDPVADTFQQAADQCGARLVPHRWQNSFAAARNAGLQAARGDWIFWIDSDETLHDLAASALRKLLGRSDILGYYVTIEDLNGVATMSPRQHPSLYRRREEIRYVGRIHEHFDPPLEFLAQQWGMKTTSAPIRLRHIGYELDRRPEKLKRNIALLELELTDRPGQLYYQIELGRSLLLAGQAKGHAVLANAAQTLLPALCAPQPPTPLTAALLEYALSHAPTDFLLTRSQAVELVARWFPANAPLTWRAARWYYEQGRIVEAAELLQRVLEMGESKQYDDTLSFDQRIFGDETRLNLGVCHAKLGQISMAMAQFKCIGNSSPFFTMAQANLKHLGSQ
jgi:hypothetical protein